MTHSQLKILFKDKSSKQFKSIYLRHKKFLDDIFPNLENYCEKIYLLLNDLSEPLRCPVCDKFRKFEVFSKGYYNTCNNKECKNKVQQDAIKQTNLKRYGVESVLQDKVVRTKIKQTNLERYGMESAIQTKQVQEKTKMTNLKKYGVENAAQSIDVQDKIKQTNLDRYGTEHASQSDVIKDKIKQSNLDRYGVEYVLQNEEKMEKMKQTMINKYGVEHALQNKEIFDKFKQTNLNRYGVEHALQNKEIFDKLKQTNLEKYGTACSLNNEQVKEKTKQTNLNRYGVEYALQNYELYQKMKQTMLERYGVEHALQSQEMHQKIKQTNLNRYGVEHLMYNKDFRSKIAKSSKVSRLEKKMIELLTNRGIRFQHQYIVAKDSISHAFDFAVFDNETLVCLIDTDGVYYHGYIDDQNGKKVYEDYDTIRMMVVPENVKFVAIVESDFENGVKDLFKTLEIDYDTYVSEIYQWCRTGGFPYPSYSDNVVLKSYQQLCKDIEFLPKSKQGFKVIRNFHHSIYHARTNGNVSPYEGWYNDEMLNRVIKNRVIYKNNVDPSRVLDGFNVTKIAPKVSVFQPVVAKNLIVKYLKNVDEIFDPFSGFSGRMLGTTALNKRYIGQDINEIHVKESTMIINFLKLNNVNVVVKDVLTSHGKYQSLFTCPPYGDKESWNNCDVVKTCDDWIDICLSNFKCEYYMFVVDKTVKYKNNIIDVIENVSHFSKNIEYVILI